MGLRERAESERAERQRQERNEQERREREREQLTRERAEPAARFLTEWAGQTVRPHELTELKRRKGPPSWSVSIDGFELEVEAVGKAPEAEKFNLTQIGDDGQRRDVWKPMDLLASWPVEGEG